MTPSHEEEETKLPEESVSQTHPEVLEPEGAGSVDARTTESESQDIPLQTFHLYILTNRGKKIKKQGKATTEEIGTLLRGLQRTGYVEQSPTGMTIYPYHTLDKIEIVLLGTAPEESEG
jgi:hypothetical protein